MQPIIQHLFQASSLEDVSRQRLESFVAEYPSFGIGHYLLSRKLQAEGADSYREETQKTNLLFYQPFLAAVAAGESAGWRSTGLQHTCQTETGVRRFIGGAGAVHSLCRTGDRHCRHGARVPNTACRTGDRRVFGRARKRYHG